MISGFEAQLNRWPVVGYDASGLGAWLSHCVAKVSALHGEGGADMDVRGVGSIPGASPIRPAAAPAGARETPVAKPSSPRDELELSAAGKMLDQLGQTPNVRQERIAQIKEAIANGTYDTDEKLEAALMKLFQANGIDLDE